jgi:DNA-binding NtrC family response regulator
MMAAVAAKANSVLFVDDERRVLSSMRAMFRRDYNVLLANSGEEALELLRSHPIDVVVSDQRMPGMTGVDVLKAVKDMAPRTMRILLTGYADLKAIEASINDAEVFRYLMKPCPSAELKEAVALAAGVASRAYEASGASAPERASSRAGEGVLGSRSGSFAAGTSPRPLAARPRPAASGMISPSEVEILVLSRDAGLKTALGHAIGERRHIHHARNTSEAIEALETHPIGVLVTDTAVDEREVANLTAELKAYVPELVTVIASERSDAQALITMINYGQIFRFLLKPLQVGQCRLWLESAVNKHVELRRDPHLVRRHLVVRAAADRSSADSLIGGMRDRLRRIRGRFFPLRGTA